MYGKYRYPTLLKKKLLPTRYQHINLCVSHKKSRHSGWRFFSKSLGLERNEGNKKRFNPQTLKP